MSVVETKVLGVEEASAKLNLLAPNQQTALRIGVTRKTMDLRDGVKDAILTIFHSDGPLYQDINAEIEESPGTVTGRVFTKSVVYAAAQEYGGTWEIPEIFPVNAQALAFGAPGKLGFSSGDVASGGTIFAKHTKAHPVTLPARSYARSTLFRMRGEIQDEIAAGQAGAI